MKYTKFGRNRLSRGARIHRRLGARSISKRFYHKLYGFRRSR